MKLSTFEEQISSMHLNRGELLDALLRIYMSHGRKSGGEIATSKGSMKPEPLPHFTPSKSVILALKRFKLIVSRTVAEGSGENRVYFTKLNDNGLSLGREIMQRKMKEELAFAGILSKFNNNLLFIIVDATQCPDRYLAFDGYHDWENSKQFTSFLEKTETSIIMATDRDKIREYVKRYGYAGASEGMRKDFLKKISKEYFHVFSKCLLHHPKIHKKAEELFEKLEQHGLSVTCPMYTSEGVYMHDFFSSPPEVVELILSHIYSTREVIKDLQQEVTENLHQEFTWFRILSIIVRAFHNDDFTISKVEDYCYAFDIQIERIKEAVNLELKREGITSEYNATGGPDDAPFMPGDKQKKMDEYFIRVMDMIAQQVL